MLDAEGLPYVRYRLVGRLDEERVVVAADGLVKGCKFGLVEDVSVLVANLGFLRHGRRSVQRRAHHDSIATSINGQSSACAAICRKGKRPYNVFPNSAQQII